ncbi:ABC transporter ATP-binding protein [Halomonas organivorans]|uniref:NitT/TauT family transport system ATP-binding protein n=1 Tax=Halomonas organivorans TaxID=257772 RepID=A0A7W5BWP9_9GAMM|nr:ABC transporter ATP-binding protein [Halomonas organivorans]MBB3140476.1 NitT/TauT family transport system ATP-binding protein [Halomonas organivorans]
MSAADTAIPVLNARGIRLGFGDATVLDDVDLAVHPREFVAIVGASGVGKSTLLRALSGLLSPRAGTVNIPHGQDRDSRAWSMVFQAPRLFPWRRVRANVELGLEGLELSRDERRQRALEPLALVGLEEYAERWPHTLSGGQQQRVGIARALAVRPRVLFMDEPFSALDAITRRRLQQELIDLRQRTEAAIVFVTHDIEEAVLLADQVVVLGRQAAGQPAGVVARHEVTLPTVERRDHPDFADQVQAVEAAIGEH